MAATKAAAADASAPGKRLQQADWQLEAQAAAQSTVMEAQEVAGGAEPEMGTPGVVTTVAEDAEVPDF